MKLYLCSPYTKIQTFESWYDVSSYPMNSSVLWFCTVMMAFGIWRPY